MGGDVHVRVYVQKHATFERKGADLFMEKKISLIEALSGTNFVIKHLDGKNLKVFINILRFLLCHKKFWAITKSNVSKEKECLFSKIV
jgi:DnaJ-class molecular chaperone